MSTDPFNPTTNLAALWRSFVVIDTETNKVKMIAHGSVCGASFAPDLPARLVYARGPAGSFC